MHIRLQCNFKKLNKGKRQVHCLSFFDNDCVTTELIYYCRGHLNQNLRINLWRMITRNTLQVRPKTADGDIDLVSFYHQKALNAASNTLVSPLDRFLPTTFSIMAANALISSWTRFNGEKVFLLLKICILSLRNTISNPMLMILPDVASFVQLAVNNRWLQTDGGMGYATSGISVCRHYPL